MVWIRKALSSELEFMVVGCMNVLWVERIRSCRALSMSRAQCFQYLKTRKEVLARAACDSMRRNGLKLGRGV